MGKLICGVGVNDADYVVRPTIKGKESWCPFYSKWQSMLKRCYSEKCQTKNPTYIGCSVCKEWLTFSNFKSWMEKQDWEGKELDKDLLVQGNRLYSPEKCIFIDKIVNIFTIDRGNDRGEWPIGVSLHKSSGKLKAQCGNPFTKKYEHLGLFSSPQQAHQAWRKRKHELACQLADLQTDERVANALRTRYLAFGMTS